MDKLLWRIWRVVTALILLGTIGFQVSSKPEHTDIRLVNGQSFEISTFSLLPRSISLELEFFRTGDDSRPELGKYGAAGNWRETGYLFFENPGVPIKLLLKSLSQQVTYEALPVTRKNGQYSAKKLVVYEDDNNLNQFSWPATHLEPYHLSTGFNKLTVTILNVSELMRDEKVTFIIQPPIGKSVAKGYRLLSYFYFWPVYAFILFIFYLILLYRKKKAHV